MGRPRSFEDDEVFWRAMQEFWTHGYAETSPAMLAEATGLRKGSRYYALGTKRYLFDRSLAHYERIGEAVVKEVLEAAGDTRAVLRVFLRSLVDADRDGNRRGCLNVNTSVELARHDP